MACGDTVYGLSKAYQTYTSAVILLQSSYFFPENTLLTSAQPDESPDVQSNIFSDSPAAAFADALSRLDQISAETILQKLYTTFYKNHRFLQNPVKDLYTNFFYAWKMPATNRRLPVPEMLKVSPKQLMTVSHFRSFIRP